MSSRRKALKFLAFSTLVTLNLKADDRKLYLRPPGALNEKDFRASCIKCGQCVQVCPYHSISLLDITHLFDIGTPVINANERGCYLCDALPCVLACPSGALSHETNSPLSVQMGMAIISNIDACLAHKAQKLDNAHLKLKKAKTEQEHKLNENLSQKVGEICDLCVSCCPYPKPIDAIEMTLVDGKFLPLIKEKCVGCGACAELCPAQIINIIPRADYRSVYKEKL